MKQDANQIKELIKSRLKSKDIVLWGYDEKAKEFYYNYKEIYRIKKCVTEKIKHPFWFDDEQTIPIVEWEKYEGEEKDFIVIFSSPFVHIENQILASGMKIFEEYVDSSLVEVALSDKKIAIMAGNCQIATIGEFLSQLEIFKEEYMFFRFLSHKWKSRYSMKSLSYLKNICDLYICMRHEDDDIKFFSKEELPEHCKILTLPSSISRLYWPQMKIGRKSAENEYFMKNIMTYDHGPFEYGDVNINRLIEEGKSPDEIVAILSDENFYTKEEVEDHLEMAMRVLECEEYGCDVKYLSYIQENFQKNMLYKDMIHLQVSFIWWIVRQLLMCLQLDTSEAEEMERLQTDPKSQEYSVHCTEVPVYPSVAKHMGLEWCNKDTLYDVTFYNGRRKMTFEEYIRAYYDICSKMKQIFEQW